MPTVYYVEAHDEHVDGEGLRVLEATVVEGTVRTLIGATDFTDVEDVEGRGVHQDVGKPLCKKKTN